MNPANDENFEPGKPASPPRAARPRDGMADPQTQPADVRSDRVPATDAEPEGSLEKVKAAPLGIEEIESLEDDAKGG